MAKRNVSPASNLKLENYSDREILHLLNDLGDNDGWVSVEELGQRIGLVTPSGMSAAQKEIHTARCVGTRLSWIRRLSDTVERSIDKKAWRLTGLGEKVVSAKLKVSVANDLDQIDTGALLLAVDAIGRRYTKANDIAGNLLRREWAYGTHKNRRR